MKSLTATGRLLILTIAGALAPVAAWALPTQTGWYAPVAACAAILILGGALAALTHNLQSKAAKDAGQLAEGVRKEHYPAGFEVDGLADVGLVCSRLNEAYGTMKERLGLASAVLGGIPTPFVVVDKDENLIRTNPALIEILEQTGNPEDHYGDNVAHFFYGDATRPTVLRTCIQEHVTVNKEVELIGRRGGVRNIHIFASPLFDLDGENIGAMCIYLDKTELRAREKEIGAHNAMVARAVSESESVAGEVASVAGELSAQIGQSTARAGEQANGAEEVATAMEQMNQAVFDVAKSATDASSQAGEAKDKALVGQDVVQQAVTAIDEVFSLASSLRENLADLGVRADAIGSVMAVINDIADQTNLLALNAAIEAARAGEAGRGFAVVADEVRKLAEKTMDATQEVGDAVSSIQSGTQANIRSMDEASRAIESARGLSESSGAALAEIVELVVATSDVVRSIATAAEEQSAASAHISQSVDNARSLARDMAEDLGSADRGIGSLSELSERLRTIICNINPDSCHAEL